MKIVLDAEHSVELRPGAGALAIESPDGERAYSAFHMLGSALATCTYAVLVSWAEQAELDSDDLALRVRWEFDDPPTRVTAIELDIVWPSLPATRRDAAHRAASQCTVHHTLEQGTDVRVAVTREPAEKRARAEQPDPAGSRGNGD